MLRICCLFIILALAASCLKKAPEPVDGSGCRFASARDSVTNLVRSSAEYDVLGRITKYQSEHNSLATRITYTQGTATVQDVYPDGSPAYQPYAYSLNAQGFAEQYTNTSSDTSGKQDYTTSDTLTYAYTDDGEVSGYVRKSVKYIMGTNTIVSISKSVRTYTYLAGRLTKEADTDIYMNDGNTSVRNSITDYIYSELSPTVFVNPVLGHPYGELFGRMPSDKIPVKSERYYVYSSGTTQVMETNTYTAVVDSKGKPTKIRTATYYPGSGTNISTRIYSYVCK